MAWPHIKSELTRLSTAFEGPGLQEPLTRHFESHRPPTDDDLEALVQMLRLLPEVTDLFEGRIQFVGANGGDSNLNTLARWLLWRTRAESSDRAVRALREYLTSGGAGGYQIMALRGLRVTSDLSLADDLRLCSFETLPNSSMRGYLLQRGPGTAPSAYLVREFVLPKLHVKQRTSSPGRSAEVEGYTELEDARICLAVAGPCSPQFEVFWCQAAEDYPLGWLGSSYSHAPPGRIPPMVQVDQEAIGRASEVLGVFRTMKGQTRAVLHVSLTRLGRAMYRETLLDTAIDLGIAAESIFVPEKGELVHRLRTRAARFLGASMPDRKRIHRLFGDLYKLRSKAVHGGSVPETDDTRKCLDESARLISLAIHRYALEPVDWAEFDLA